VNAGGDTDTNGAMLGALLGALNGTQVFPQHLIDGLVNKDNVINTADRLCDVFGI
jgi:ADP-ribosylglycohydrolase